MAPFLSALIMVDHSGSALSHKDPVATCCARLSCGACAERLFDSVVRPDGHIFDREAILECLLQQKLDIQVLSESIGVRHESRVLEQAEQKKFEEQASFCRDAGCSRSVHVRKEGVNKDFNQPRRTWRPNERASALHTFLPMPGTMLEVELKELEAFTRAEQGLLSQDAVPSMAAACRYVRIAAVLQDHRHKRALEQADTVREGVSLA